MSEQEILDKPASITEFNAVEAGLAELRKDLKGVQFDVTKTEGDKAARAARARCVSIRTGAEKVYKDWNAPMLEKQRGMRELVKKITEAVTAIEEPIDAQIKAEEERRAEIKRAKEEAERAIQQAIQDRITALAQYPMKAVGKDSAGVAAILATVAELPITTELYAHRAGEAMALHAEVAGKLEQMHGAAVAQEQEAARVAAERAEMERQRQAQEAAAKAEREAEAARLAEERKALEAEQKRLQAEREAENARQEAARAEQRRQEEAAAAEARRREEEAAAAMRAQQEQLDRDRRAFEEQQAAARRAEEERQEAAARAERERQEAEARAQREKEEAERRAAAEAAREEVRAARMAPEHTGGTWSVGRDGAVVTDAPIPGMNSKTDTGHDEVQYYGGHLIAESIWRPADARLLAAAPAMLDALRQWQSADRNADREELENAAAARDAAITAATQPESTTV